MSSAAAARMPSKSEVQSLVMRIQAGNTLLVRNLQAICQINGLSRSGVKADLQRRIIHYINECVAANDSQKYHEVEKSVRDNSNISSYSSLSQGRMNPYSSPSDKPSSYSSQKSSAIGVGHGYQNALEGLNGHKMPASSSLHGAAFKASPFYEIISRLGNVHECDIMVQHRASITITIKPQDFPALQQCSTDPNLRVMVMCAADRGPLQDISFPPQSELRVNGGEVKANLRGLKNKPGSTRPADITSALRFKPSHYLNNVDFTYALTNKKYYIAAYLCKVTPVETLAAAIMKGKKIQKASVISEITKKAQDPDVIATSQVLSLKCPLTYMRISVPCRSLSCNHIQCFDATSYLQLQEQGPQWICPVCNKPAPFSQLAVDEYVQDILAKTAPSVEQVTIETDGQWSVPGDKKDEMKGRPSTSFIEDDGLLVPDVSFVSARSTATPIRSVQTNGTTTIEGSRESSAMPRSVSSSKRPAAEVIDLTLTDDDEPPVPAPKRQNTGSNVEGAFVF